MVGGVVVLAALGTIASVATSADAYPPGTKLAVSALSIVPTPSPANTFAVTLFIEKAPPNCQLVISVNGVVYGTPTSGGLAATKKYATVTTTVTLPPSKDSTSTIEVKTNCPPNKKEKAKTKVVLRRAKFDIDDECRKNKPCKIEVKNFPPGENVSFVFRQAFPGTGLITRDKPAGGDGRAKVEITFPSEGAWGAVATGGGATADTTLQVKKK